MINGNIPTGGNHQSTQKKCNSWHHKAKAVAKHIARKITTNPKHIQKLFYSLRSTTYSKLEKYKISQQYKTEPLLNPTSFRALNEADITISNLKSQRDSIIKLIHETQRTILLEGPAPQLLEKTRKLIENSRKEVQTLKAHNQKCAETNKKHNELHLFLDGLQDYLNNAEANDFRSTKNKEKLFETYESLSKSLSQYEQDEDKKQSKLKKAEKLINHAKKSRKYTKAILKLNSELRVLFKKYNNKFDELLLEKLKRNPSPFQSKIKLFINNQWVSVNLSYTPAAKMRLSTEAANSINPGQRTPFEADYENTFIPSCHGATDHAVNLLGYKMKINDQVVDSHIRVGCPYAFKEADNDSRLKSTKHRLNEIFTAILLQNHPDLLNQAISNPKSEPIQLNMAYMNFLTPDKLRSTWIGKIVGIPDEAPWLEEMQKIIKNISGKELALPVFDTNGNAHSIRITPNITMFNFPTKVLALKAHRDSRFTVKFIGKLIRKAANPWKTTDSINKRALIDLLGEDKSYQGIMEHALKPLSQEQQSEAKKLADELWKMCNDNNGKSRKIADKTGPFTFTLTLFKLLASSVKSVGNFWFR
ncbi:hypothetical protein [uncultured Endozoicomonas sp.]|uniref:hypothetical protein n=1 Tax=uncultured Endozoicomonas sp. TaxID=432652 RepID=UPI00260C4E40|nr:hypothetical protein [uncultured Endozoicomonas sp.]